MPGMDGFRTIEYAKKNWPEMKIIALTLMKERIYIMSLIESGIKGILFKESFERDLEMALRKVIDGEIYYCDQVYQII